MLRVNRTDNRESRGGYDGWIPGCGLRFHLSTHFCYRLKGRWGCRPSDVLERIPRGRVVAWNHHDYYLVELSGGAIGLDRMLVVLASPDRHDPGGVALVTAYPAWDGNIRAAHIGIAFDWGMELVPNRPVLDVLQPKRAA
jgi:hypothetical protein